jgi:hypothetical protein
VQRREVFEVAGVGDPLGVLAVDRLDAEQREVALDSFGGRIWPCTTWPLRRPKRRIWLGLM